MEKEEKKQINRAQNNWQRGITTNHRSTVIYRFLGLSHCDKKKTMSREQSK